MKTPMGMKKHGKSGYSGKGPKIRQFLKREAEKQEVKRKDRTKYYSSIHEIPPKG